jgi:hypothetical protein
MLPHVTCVKLRLYSFLTRHRKHVPTKMFLDPTFHISLYTLSAKYISMLAHA